jgi:hypothetical protein
MSSGQNLTTIVAEVTTCLYRTKTLASTYDIFTFIFGVPFMLLIGPAGIAGNVLSFIVIGREKPFTSTSVILRSLAVADGMVLAAELLATTFRKMYDYFGILVMYREFQEMSYPYLWTLKWFSKTISIYLAVGVATERYIAVCKPLRAASVCTKRNAYIASTSIFICSFLYRIPLIFDYEVIYLFDPCSGTRRPWWIYSALEYNRPYRIGYATTLQIIINCCIPICTLIFFTYAIISALKEAKKNLASQTSGRRSEETIAVTQRVLAVVVVFIVLETPGAIYQILESLIQFSGLGKFFNYDAVYGSSKICYFLGFFNSFVNFFIYCATGRRFRRTLRGMFNTGKQGNP